ncbi:MAG TPA: hypothetical protein VJ652_15180 [Noviherbaspirillum sp.]|nr:hypothetical protein [Noviherbaspirillum sp.]
MDTSNIDKVVDYTKQFIEAATPIAKQAYEIGLLTVRIDAAASLIPSIILTIVCSIIAVRLLSNALKKKSESDSWCNEKARDERDRKNAGAPPQNSVYKQIHLIEPRDWKEFCPIVLSPEWHYVAGGICSGVVLLCIPFIMDVWLWVKLFAPDLWLAHQAIEKLLK